MQEEQNMQNKRIDKEQEKHRIFKQLIQAFYYQSKPKEEKTVILAYPQTVKIEPKIIYNSFQKMMKIEFRIGDKQFYKLKNLPEFFSRMLKHEIYKYGAKLEFTHTKEAFEPDSLELLEYILKYAEIMKYAAEAANQYATYHTSIENGYITVSNTGMDELFSILKGQYVALQNEYEEKQIYFKDENPEIKFEIKQTPNEEYEISTDMDMFAFETIEGKEYLYFLYKDVLYRCNKEFEQTTLKLINVFKTNYTRKITFDKKELSQLFSIVYPKVKQNMLLTKMSEEDKDRYIPKELFVKLYLDFNAQDYMIADVKFVYGDTEFNPFLQEKLEIARNIAKENEVLELFLRTGFMLDTNEHRLVLASEEKIYYFLAVEIEKYMQEFEVLATDNFKKKEIREPKMRSLGVKIENNLLSIDLSQMDFKIEELQTIMEKYRLKKKYHRLQDGSFLELENSNVVKFIAGMTDGIDVDYRQIEKGKLKLPLYRSMYLERLLENLKNTSIVKDEQYKELVKNINHKELDDQIIVPKELHADLRNYQKIGFKWLSLLDKYQLGGILADDMGLGKTVQVLAVILSYLKTNKTAKPSIVVCPSSLTLNWDNEVKKFAPTMRSLVIRGNAEERSMQIRSINDYELVITSYDLLKRDIEIYEELNYEFKYIIADEAQYIKNNHTQNAKAIKKIHSETRFALTGTPIENSLSELWSIFDFIMPGYLFYYRKFKELYEIPIVKDNDEQAMQKLKMLIEPFILRRIKKEVLLELPDKTVTILNNEMQEEQLKIYASYMAKAKKEAVDEIKENGFEKSQIKILALLMRLRQICCHPSLFLSNYQGESSKLNQCTQVIKDAVTAGHKILLFSGYTSMFDIIEKELKKQKIKYFKLTGQTKVGDRIKLVDEFNENDEIKVFLISLKAGGTGLNLIGADMVIHYDPWWNLSAENQATDRTYRIGQKRNVQVYKMITKNSIEEKIYELQQKKARLADNMLSTEQTFINKLSKDDIMALFE